MEIDDLKDCPKTKEELNYAETLKIVEKFMEKTGIRHFCTDYCGGQCCNPCYENNKDKNCRIFGRRLECSMFICDALKTVLLNESNCNKYRHSLRVIENEFVRQNDDGSMYFIQRKKETMERFRLKRSSIEFYEDNKIVNEVFRRIYGVMSLFGKSEVYKKNGGDNNGRN